VDLNVAAIERGVVPVAAVDFNDPAVVEQVQAFFVDTLMQFNQTTTPLHSVRVGYDHGLQYGAVMARDGVAVQYLDASTNYTLVTRFVRLLVMLAMLAMLVVSQRVCIAVLWARVSCRGVLRPDMLAWTAL